MCHFQDQNGPFVIKDFFLVQTIIITFIYLLAFFMVQNLKKFLQQIQSYEDVKFSGRKWSIFFCKIINTILIYLLAPIIVQIFKKFFQRIHSYQDMQFLRPKWPISPNENFFRKPVNEPCFFHSCLSICQKSKSDINPFVNYWQFENIEISLAKSHFWL